MARRLTIDDRVNKINKFFNNVPKIFYGDLTEQAYCLPKKNEVYLNRNYTDREKALGLIHEQIHLSWKIDHDKIARKIGYNSESKDYLSEVMYYVIFRQKYKR